MDPRKDPGPGGGGVTERRTGEELWRGHRLKKAGYVLAEGPEGENLWREPGTGRLLPEGRAEGLVQQQEEREVREAGWEPEEVEGVRYWRNPNSGYLYPLEAAHDRVSGEDEGGGASGRGSSHGADQPAD
jgi:hypothetical protein